MPKSQVKAAAVVGLITALLLLQIAAWVVHWRAWMMSWWEAGKLAIAAASVGVGAAIIFAGVRKSRVALFVAVVLLLGQWNVWRPALWLLSWRFTGFAP